MQCERVGSARYERSVVAGAGGEGPPTWKIHPADADVPTAAPGPASNSAALLTPSAAAAGTGDGGGRPGHWCWGAGSEGLREAEASKGAPSDGGQRDSQEFAMGAPKLYQHGRQQHQQNGLSPAAWVKMSRAASLSRSHPWLITIATLKEPVEWVHVKSDITHRIMYCLV